MTKKPILPGREPKPLIPIPMKNLEEIEKGLQGFVSQWRFLCAKDLFGEYQQKYEYLQSYSTKVLDVLPLEVFPCHLLHNKFWPMSQITLGTEHLFNDFGEVREEYGRNEHFIS